jgi:hypothetical protein
MRSGKSLADKEVFGTGGTARDTSISVLRSREKRCRCRWTCEVANRSERCLMICMARAIEPPGCTSDEHETPLRISLDLISLRNVEIIPS